MTVVRTIVALLILSFAGAAAAQMPLTNSTPDVEAAVKALEAGGATVLIVPSPDTEPAPAVADTNVHERVAALRREAGAVVGNAPRVPGQMVEALRAAGNGSIGWVLPAGLITLAALVTGAIAWFFAMRFVISLGKDVEKAPKGTRAALIARDIGILIKHVATTAAFFFVATGTVLMIQPDLSPERVTASMAIWSITILLLVRGLLSAVLSPWQGAERALPFSDRLSLSLYAQLMTAGVLSTLVTFVCYWFAYFPLVETAHKLMLLIAPTVSVLLFSVVLLVHRKEISAAILGTEPRRKTVRRFMAAVWPLLATAYLALAWALTAVGVLEATSLALGPITGPFLGLAVSLGVAGVLIIVHDRRLTTRNVDPRWTELYERTAINLSFVAGAATLVSVWHLFAGPWGAALERGFAIALVLIFGWALWQAVRLAVEIRLEDEVGTDPQPGEGEGFGPGGSRLATLLPILRNVALFFIGTIVLTVFLASMGVNVAPLFAGAGVVGLAIGFGAQALIRDIFSGAFFLLDDAFRKGEYIQVGSVQGMVEKISVRSFQLRHHEGALHTLPFGEIKQLTNYSRDWVIMKLPVRLTYDTDVEKVRKLVKKLGQEMAADPDFGHLFLEPPKSQGVVQMEDSAMIMRVKFKTRPGDQFLVRRHVFQRLRDLFDANGIDFAHKVVTVQVSDVADPAQRRKAALGAAQDDIDAAAGKAATEFAAQ
ncbi:MAG: mechanosensitive ion channel family protein [Pseudomonadota bacterium]